MSRLFVTPLENGRRFVATERHEPDIPPFDGLNTDQLRSYVARLWQQAYEAKRPENERLKTLELLYSGFHYKDPILNRQNEVTNYCFATVETVWPVMTEQRPRPEIVPRISLRAAEVRALQDFAQWLMDQTEFDYAVQAGTRTKLKYGWNMTLIAFDPETGMPYPKPYSNFDFYPDPTARHEDELDHFFLAGPVSTRRLKAMFPHCADEIKPDAYVSPGYDVLVRPYYFERQGQYGLYGYAGAEPALSFSKDFMDWRGNAAESVATTGTSLVQAPVGDKQLYGDTTFLLQLFVRDYGTMNVTYAGEIHGPDPTGQTPFIQTPGIYRDYEEPCCESGWRVIQMTASGYILDSKPLDPAFMGLPVVFGRDYPQPDRFYCPGEIDMIAPINRAYNRRKNLLNKSLEFQAVPVVVADKDVMIDFDQTTIEPGDVLRKARGSEIHWLEYNGPAQHQFDLLEREQRDLDVVSGVHDVQQGRRPAGIEAASAIRSLQQAAQVRIRGKENPALREYAILLKKLMVCAGKKMNRVMWFKASNGQMQSIDPKTLCYEYDIAFAEGTGSRESNKDLQDLVLQLAQMGMVDQQELLERLDYPGREEIVARMMMQQQMALAAQAASGQGGEAAA